MKRQYAMLTKREIAQQILENAFQGGVKRVSSKAVMETAVELGVSKRTLQRVVQKLGIKSVHNGNLPAFWEKPKQ